MNSQKDEVIEMVLSKVKMPFNDTPLEQIIDFRKDSEALSKLRALRLWCYDFSIKDEDIKIKVERLEQLLDDYNKYMKVQKMKFNLGFFEFALTTTLEVIENIAKFNFSKLTQSMFKLKYNKISLIEKEMKAPGREVAYISMINEKFDVDS